MDDSPAAPAESPRRFPIVGIGASAGGLEAISELLSALPASPGMAFLVVQHLDAAYESLLAELLGKHTALRVTQAECTAAIVPDHVYVIAPGTSLALAGGTLCVSARDTESPHTPIDLLFRSLAEELGQSAIGVVLSGGGSDGARGLGAIKEAGGVGFAQDPVSAKFATMPNSAVEAGYVDFIGTPGAIARELVRIGDHPYLNTQPAVEPEIAEVTSAPIGEQQLKVIFRLLQQSSGLDFSHYKRNTIQRRLARRMALQQSDTLAAYTERLQDDPAEQQALLQDLLIRVTSFFRDPDTFEALCQDVFPALLKARAPQDAVRIWVPGCATGEEVYSIAICLFEFLGEAADSVPIQLFGTDVNELAIERARTGLYLHNISGEVSHDRLQRFFVKLDGHYQIAKWVRDCCVFATQNITRDPPFSRVDLVSCRNLLIYFDQALQRQVLALFHYALKPHGYLVLGMSETAGHGAALFEVMDKHQRISARKAVASQLGAFNASRLASTTRPIAAVVPALFEPSQLQREVDRILLACYGPAAVVVDDNLTILEFRGDSTAYLEHRPGAASLNLHKLAAPGLLVALAPAIQAARQNGGGPVRRDGIRLQTPDGAVEMSLEVSRV